MIKQTRIGQNKHKKKSQEKSQETDIDAKTHIWT